MQASMEAVAPHTVGMVNKDEKLHGQGSESGQELIMIIVKVSIDGSHRRTRRFLTELSRRVAPECLSYTRPAVPPATH